MYFPSNQTYFAMQTAGHMISNYITKTYPNHQSIATGFYEENHGIVSNHFYDPRYNQTFDIDKSPDYWWTEWPVTPVWTVNQLYGQSSGVMQWPGAHVRYRDQSPRYLQNYNHSIPWNTRIDTMIGWLTDGRAPASCVFAYFDEPDATSHEFGPFSTQTYTRYEDIGCTNSSEG
ncbi:unnamed protein product [Oppiella nova]|uniref:Uncharacterized protein n=1 Tax=Oppiella nova TaxID=334625 RepID=A0A7R9M5J0_9ACAR|nr:unnamed protein product [Oppiella nova]CAG2171177.1 unnamed protein product [Oppiella nova]